MTLSTKQLVAAAAAVAALASCASASNPNTELESARGWGQKGLYEKAFSTYRPLAEAGNPEAQFQIGLLYEHGLGVQLDPGQAARWYEKAVAKQHVAALRQLASLYFEGRGVKANQKQAAELLSVASAQGDAAAKAFLAYMYENGYGVEKNLPAAIRLLSEAADDGHPAAQNALAIMYWRGVGVQQDHVRAYAWWVLASEGGDKLATENKERLMLSLSSEDRMKGEQLAKDYRERGRSRRR